MKTFIISTFTAMFTVLSACGAIALYFYTQQEEILEVILQEPYIEEIFEELEEPTYIPEEEPEDLPCPYTVRILISAAGDVTLGGDRRWGGYRNFMRQYEDNGYGYFFSNVADIFYESDLTVVNLEGTLTDISYPHMDKEFVFRAPVHFAQILAEGHIDAVSIANNHTQDYFLRGYNDTRDALTAANIEYFGNEYLNIIEVNGVKVGLFGHRIWADFRENRSRITKSISDLKAQGAELIIAYFHWGTENENFPEQYQINIGRFTINEGADLVLGSHPHVIQGIEKYNGRFIVYSLADFCFGGNAHPNDHDSFIFQQAFTFYRGVLQPENEINIIPVFMSSVRNTNDFRPTPAEGDAAERIMERLRRYSEGLGGEAEF
jgi:poly-gamma-glutamate synthesis protein (capsule biosynthesis protein)